MLCEQGSHCLGSGADALADLVHGAPLAVSQQLADLGQQLAVGRDIKALSRRPAQLQRPAVVLRRPAGLLDVQYGLSWPRGLHVQQRVAGALPSARDTAALVLVV